MFIFTNILYPIFLNLNNPRIISQKISMSRFNYSSLSWKFSLTVQDLDVKLVQL